MKIIRSLMIVLIVHLWSTYGFAQYLEGDRNTMPIAQDRQEALPITTLLSCTKKNWTNIPGLSPKTGAGVTMTTLSDMKRVIGCLSGPTAGEFYLSIGLQKDFRNIQVFDGQGGLQFTPENPVSDLGRISLAGPIP